MIQATGADGKEYEMYAIPFRYVFGWLFSVDVSKVNEDARENVLKYKLTTIFFYYLTTLRYCYFIT
jgi:hypothetical protein